MYTPRLKDTEFVLSTILATGTGVLGFGILSNRIVHNHTGDGNNRVATRWFQNTMPTDFKTVQNVIVNVYRVGNADSCTLTMYINDVVDASINAVNILPGTAGTYTTYTLTPGSPVSANDLVALKFIDQCDNNEAIYILNATITYLTLKEHLSSFIFPTGNPLTSTVAYPLRMWYGYERTASIYTSTELGQFGTISALAWYIESVTTPAEGNVKIYIKTTTASTFPASSTVATEETGATLVYDGTPTGYAAGWFKINLDTPFDYTSDNLQIIVETNFGGAGGEGSSGKLFRYGSSSTNANQVWLQDTTPPTSLLGTRSALRPNIQIYVS